MQEKRSMNRGPTAHDLVLSAGELHNIRRMVQPPEITDTQAARLALKKLSDDKISRWPNTLAARRKHKEEARSRRLKAEEDARLANDKRLAAERALDRKVRIERANRMIYEQTDRMKVLRSKRMMADIQKHREKQVKSKKR